MNCKYCGAELEEGVLICPECGKAQEEVQTEVEADACADETELTEQTEEVIEQTEEAISEEKPELSDEQKRQKRKTTVLIAAIAVLGALVVALAAILLVPKISQAIDDAKAAKAQREEEVFLASLPSYYATEEELTDEVLDTVVATCGENSITNRDFPFYYWQQYRYFLDSYGQYASYIIDSSTGLDKQMYDEEQTWQQIFMDSAMQMYQSVSACVQEAEKNEFEISEKLQQSLANMEEGLEEITKSYGYESAEEYLSVNYGSGCTVEGYIEFIRKMQLAREYLNALVDERGLSDEDVSAYYDEHAEGYESSGILKVDKPTVSVRHILIAPEEKDNDGNYTEEAWKNAEKRMNEIVTEFESGELTEERFSELAENYSEDPGSATEGGLYEGVFPGQMVEDFSDWCFAEGRKTGDYGVVKTEYGYHLIFFVSQSDEIYWFETAKEDYRNELATSLEEEIAEKYASEFFAEKVKLQDVVAGGSTDTQDEG